MISILSYPYAGNKNATFAYYFHSFNCIWLTKISLIQSIYQNIMKQRPCFTCLWNLTHWGRVTHICVSELTIIGSDNGLSPGWRQAIIWNNAGLLLIEPLGTNFSEISIGIQTFSFKKMHSNMSSAKWRPFGLGFNVKVIWVKLHILESNKSTASIIRWPNLTSQY